jgi:glycosyltransferase 2 family protein
MKCACSGRVNPRKRPRYNIETTKEQTPAAPRRQPRWLIPLTLVIAAVCLYFAVRNVNWAETVKTLSQGNLTLLGLVFVVFTINCIIRGLRWRVLLSAEKKLPLAPVFWSMMTGYLGNSYLPARAGEVIRSVLIGERGGVSKSFALATALTERIADAVILVSVCAAALATMGSLPPEISQAIRLMAVIGAIGIVLVFIAPRMGKLIHAIIQRLPIAVGLREKLDGMADSFLFGAGALQDPGRLAQFAALSAVMWSLDTVVGTLLARAFNLPLTPAQVFVLIAALGIGSAIPSTPGALGIYQLIATAILVPFGLSNSQALAYIIAFQGNQYIGITVWGLVGLLNPGGKQVKKETQ